MKVSKYLILIMLLSLTLIGCNSQQENETVDSTNIENVESSDIDDEIVESSNSENQYILVEDDNLETLPEDLEKPETIAVGDVGLVLEDKGEYFLVDFIRPVGDLPDDWSFARGYVPKENTILNPSEEKLRELSNVARLKDGEITLEDSLNGNEYLEQGNRYVSIIEVDDDRLLIEMPSGANDAWVSSSDVDYNLGYFEGYSD